jgi:hypothetical protein
VLAPAGSSRDDRADGRADEHEREGA